MQNDKMSIKKKLNFLFILSIISIFLINSVNADPISDALIHSTNSSNNNSIYINSTVYIANITVLDDGRILLYGVISNSTETPRFCNINETYNSVIEFYNIQGNVLCYNGTNICNGTSTDISQNTGNLNVTIPSNQCFYWLDSYLITNDQAPVNSPITGGSTDHHYNLVSNLTSNTIIPITLTHNCSSLRRLIYYNGTYSFPNYGCTGNTLTTNVSIIPGQSNFILDDWGIIVNYKITYNSNDQNGYSTNTNFISSSIVLMVANFFSLTPVLGTILGISILIAVIVFLVIYIKKWSKNDSNEFNG